MNFSRAFTMIELIFVIVVLGILAGIALPKFGATREMADIAKGRADVATIRTAIVNNRQSRVIKGDASWITSANLDTGGLFGGVLMSPMSSGSTSGDWDNSGADGDGSYRFWISTTPVPFTYTPADGKFGCSTTAATTGAMCSKLVD